MFEGSICRLNTCWFKRSFQNPGLNCIHCGGDCSSGADLPRMNQHLAADRRGREGERERETECRRETERKKKSECQRGREREQCEQSEETKQEVDL